MNQAAGLFFQIVQDSLWEDTLLHLSRITDKPETRGKPNLTIQHLRSLVTNKKLGAELCELVEGAVTKAAFARDWRNRHIAHTDLTLAIREGAKPLMAASRRGVDEALKAIDAVLNRLETHFRNGTILLERIGDPGDAECLLYVVRAGLESEEARRTRLRDCRPADGDFDARPV